MANRRYRHKKPAPQDNYKPPYSDEVLATPVTVLKLREDTAKLLEGAGIKTLYDVLKREEKDFYKISTFNKKNLFDVKNALKARNLALKPTPEKPEEQHKNESKAPEKNNNEKPREREKRNNDRGRNGIDESYVMVTKPPKPPRQKTVPIKEEPDPYVKINRGGKWGFKSRDGKHTIDAVYDEVFSYKENLCCVEKDERFGFIDRDGNVVIPIEYDCATSFSEGYACVFKKDKCGYINAKNEVVVGFNFDAATPIIGGECRVKRDGKWGEMHLIQDDDGVITTSEIRWIL